MTDDTPIDIAGLRALMQYDWRNDPRCLIRIHDAVPALLAEIERLRASSKQAGPGGWNTALEEAAKAVECICVQAMNEDFVRGAREFRKGAANVIRALKASPAAAQPEPTDDTAAKQRHEVRVKAEGFDQVLTGPVELMKPPEPKASSPQSVGVHAIKDAALEEAALLVQFRFTNTIIARAIRELKGKGTPHSAPDVVEAAGRIMAFNPLNGDWDDALCDDAMLVARAAIASAGTPGEKR